MKRQKLVTRFASASAVAALALGAVACDMDDNGDIDPGQEAPEGDVGGEAPEDDGLEDDGLDDDGLDDDFDDEEFDEDGDLGDDF
jgi:hypothetical protein